MLDTIVSIVLLYALFPIALVSGMVWAVWIIFEGIAKIKNYYIEWKHKRYIATLFDHISRDNGNEKATRFNCDTNFKHNHPT